MRNINLKLRRIDRRFVPVESPSVEMKTKKLIGGIAPENDRRGQNGTAAGTTLRLALFRAHRTLLIAERR